MKRPLGEYTRTFKEVAQYLGKEDSGDQKIRGICSNSNNIEAGDLFVAIPGGKNHGAKFIDDAISKGAVAAVTDAAGADIINKKIPTLIVANPRAEVGPLANWFYGAPSSKFNLVGITGTNGKTTTSYLLNQIWKSAGKSTALIGTLGVEICGENFKTQFTTPEADALTNTFAIAAEQHVTLGVMEVSSIAIEMKRISGTHFKYVAFSNLTQDHLDFHGNMEKYGAAKAKLFTLQYAENAIINIDDPFGKKLFETAEIPAISVSRSLRNAIWHFEKISQNGHKTEVSIRGEGGILIEGEISLLGEHNLDNLILAVAIAFHSGVDPLVIASVLPSLRGAPGRLEIVDAGQNFLALVDYAHTPDAVTHTLQTAKKLGERVIAVLGCGGDRDATKRSLMGIELSSGSDLAIFTSDNPRSESAESILDEMLSRVSIDDKNVRITDRREAIAFAVASAKEGDCVVILGKGHELGQEISGQVLPFDDRVELAKAIEALS
jgi:UDP-N-acetylmuramoyl-L-alanyl-D-glutamate--2,6-diaminopimelate ligase